MRLLQKIIINGNPSTVTAQQDGEKVVGGRYIQHYIKPNVKAAKEDLARQLLPYKPAEPYKGPLNVWIVWKFSRKSWDNKEQKTSFRTTRPDLDNLCKGCADVLTSLGFWADDSEVCEYHLAKMWSADPCLIIAIAELEKEDYKILDDATKGAGT
jgi:Holliday junction resolvase RusA-like endonuclease